MDQTPQVVFYGTAAAERGRVLARGALAIAVLMTALLVGAIGLPGQGLAGYFAFLFAAETVGLSLTPVFAANALRKLRAAEALGIYAPGKWMAVAAFWMGIGLCPVLFAVLVGLSV